VQAVQDPLPQGEEGDEAGEQDRAGSAEGPDGQNKPPQKEWRLPGSSRSAQEKQHHHPEDAHLRTW
jgi:hypothetical protein